MPKDRDDRPQVPDFLPEDVARRIRRLTPSATAWSGAVIAGLLVAFGVAMVVSGFTYVEAGEVAVVVNNLGGGTRVKLDPGTVFHLPLGIMQVYKLDRSEQVLQMTGDPRRGDRAGTDNVRVKTNDGSNIHIDVEVRYQIDPGQAVTIVRNLRRGGEAIGKVLRAYTRSVIRDEFGRLSIEQIADPAFRQEKIHAAKRVLGEELERWGLLVNSLSTTNFLFDPQYTELIKSRKEADQIKVKQVDAQQAALQEQERALNQGRREKNVALEEEKGRQTKRVVTMEQGVLQILARAEGEAYRLRLEGDQEYAVAAQEAQAVLTEGTSRAQGIKALAAAYEKGGLALVREALARKYIGRTLNGRPYSLESLIERVQVERAEDRERAAALLRDDRAGSR